MTGAPVRILVVDDERPHLEALCEVLDGDGYAAVGFTSPAEALEAMEPAGFDVLLTDLMMPGMSGIELLQAGLQIDPTLVGVIMTGAASVASAVEAMKAGALDYLLKPFKRADLLHVIARALVVRDLRRENAALERGLRERGAELEVINQGLEAFAHSISHDLRAPLRAVGGFVGILLEDHGCALPEEARRLFDRVVVNVKHMEALTAGLLRLSRAGGQQLRLERVDAQAMVQRLADGLRQEHAGQDCAVTIGPLHDCCGDAALIMQVFANLLGNAFKYTRTRASAVIGVTSEANDREVVYHIRDNGVGFAMTDSGKLFGVFQRLHRDDEFEGTGVGLSIVQRIVQRHGGRVWAQAAPHEGACFSFGLPIIA